MENGKYGSGSGKKIKTPSRFTKSLVLSVQAHTRFLWGMTSRLISSWRKRFIKGESYCSYLGVSRSPIVKKLRGSLRSTHSVQWYRYITGGLARHTCRSSFGSLEKSGMSAGISPRQVLNGR